MFSYLSGEGEELWVQGGQRSLGDFQVAEPYSFPVNIKTISQYNLIMPKWGIIKFPTLENKQP